MKFEIASKYEVGDVVKTKDLREVKVIHIKMRKLDKLVNIEYLVEHEDGTRVWKDEVDFV